jgi:serine/threonine-protein kinase
MAADREMLFGLLALQNGLIDQVQLVTAFHAWTCDKARSLAEHLVARGDLDAEGRTAVDVLVSRHLKRHGGDAQRSLAAVPSPASARASLSHIADPDIERSVVHLSKAASSNGSDSDRTVTYAVGAVTSDGQRFRILRPHAQGGLGAVFVALDAELHREVALKQILDRHADDPTSRQRFLIEAEITGGLEHPGIVPVYGLGVYADGRPYYAMRFIRGDSLKEAIAQFHANAALESDPGRRSLELRKLLRRFVDVCHAIGYAHSRGVLHRDVKPANVIMGEHGETLVVDWGLAKALGRSDPASAERSLVPSSASGSSETLPGSALGTPAYMSPEQAIGDLGALGPRSDVYSLGASLYTLLTGKPPFVGDPGEVLRAVQRGDVAAPGTVDSTIDRALEAVCLKAMAKKPEDRYGGAQELSEDIERWMADEPVVGWQEPYSSRARRWARRNRTVVTTAGAVVLVAFLGALAVLAVQTRANRELRDANARTREERDLARQNFDLARRAVNDYLTRVGQNPLLKEQGLHALRQELLEAALGYYRDFLRQRSTDPKLRSETAAAHERVGDILLELGRPTDALAAYDQGIALIEPLVRERPGDPVFAMAQVRVEAGRLQALKEISSREALITFDRLKVLGESVLARGQDMENLPNVLARAYAAAAIILRNTGRIDDALRAALRAHELADRAARERPGDPSLARTRLYATIQAVDMSSTARPTDEARSLCERGIAFGKASVRDHPRDIEMRLWLACLEGQLAEIEMYQGRPLGALPFQKSSTDTLAVLARENPLIIRVRSQWGISLWALSSLQTNLRQYADAEQSARTAIQVNEAIAREVPSYPFYRLRLGYSYGVLGKALLKRGSPREGLAELRKSIAIVETSHEIWGLYNLAAFLALASTTADPAEGPAAVDRQRRDADRAMDALRRAYEMGMGNMDPLRNDPDLDALRVRPDFQTLLKDRATRARTVSSAQ